MAAKAITPETVRARARLAGVRIEEELLGETARALEQSLAPLRTLDPHGLRSVEPPVAFRAAGGDAGSPSR